MSFEGWKEVELGDVLEIKKEIYKPQYREDLPYIGLEHIGQGDLRIHGTGSAKEVESNKYRFKKGDILFGKLRPYFRKVVMPKIDGVCSTDIWVLKTKSPEMADQVFLYYLMASEPIIEMATSSSTGTRMPRADWNHLSKVRIHLPDLPTQKKIAKLLAGLDEKIELNNRINKNLEEMAQAIFKSWFVDFEPFRDGEFVESELGMIPKGWDVKSLDEIASFLNGLAMQKYRPTNDEYLPVIKIKELRQGYTTPDSDKATTQLHSDYIVNDGDVLFSWSGTLEVKVWCGGKGALNQHLFKVTSEMYEKWFYYHWTKFHLDRFRRIAKDKATTMGHIRRKDLSESKVFVPDQSTYERINEIMKPIFDQIITLNIQSRKLEKIRNTLLPKLMSGEIRVPLD